jgi:NO-binding membrane sensor protein with MHYT domain/signal transduction histidine kinase
VFSDYFYDGTQPGLAIVARYDPTLVFLSVAIVSLASYATLNIAGRINASEKNTSKQAWFLAGALSMGIGAWAMHFIGVLALKLPFSISYDLLTTVLSTIPAILGCAIVLSVSVNSWHRGESALLFAGAGALQAACIGAMHYTGMMAMHGVGKELIMRFEPLQFGLSIVLAVALGYASVYIFYLIGSKKEDHYIWWVRIGAAAVIGFAVAGMHYTGMAATYFFQGESYPDDGQMALSPFSLAIPVFFVSILITMLAIAVIVIDRRLKKAADAEQSSRSQMVEAIESISDGFSLYDMNDRLAVCNQGYREMMDCGSGIIPGMSFESIIRDIAEAGRPLDAAGRIDEWVNERLMRHQTPRGSFIERWSSDRWFRVSERRVWNIGTVAISTDITELKRAEMELSKAMKDRATLERLRSVAQMVAGVAHEINTPLGIACTALSIIDRRLSSPHIGELFKNNDEDKEIFADILEATAFLKQNVNRAHKLVENFKKISVSQITETKETADLTKLIGDAVELFNLNARYANISINIDSSFLTFKKEWNGYPGYLTQIIMNLLQNIERYAYPSGKGGEVDITAADNNDENFIITVRDYGKGISRDNITKVFDPFYTTGRDKGGSGLGLAIVHNIVTTALQGSIEVSSEIDKGTMFSITIPKIIIE